MKDDKPGNPLDSLLAGLDFVALQSAQAEQHRRETADLLRSLLAVADALEALDEHCRALAEQGEARVPARSVQVIAGQLAQVLADAGVEPIPAVGGPVHLQDHEVVGTRPSPDPAADVVLAEVRRGYRWKGQLLRRSRVIVPEHH